MNNSNEWHSPAVEFSSTTEDTYTPDRASKYISDQVGGDRSKAHNLLPHLHSVARDLGKPTLTQKHVDSMVNLLKCYPELGVKTGFSNAPQTADEKEYEDFMNLTPLGQAALKAKKGTK